MCSSVDVMLMLDIFHIYKSLESYFRICVINVCNTSYKMSYYGPVLTKIGIVDIFYYIF